MVSYFSNRSHVTRYTWALHQVLFTSMPASSRAQVFGPSSYIVVGSDLYPRHECNVMVKFSDGTYLLVGSNHLPTATEKYARSLYLGLHVSAPFEYSMSPSALILG